MCLFFLPGAVANNQPTRNVNPEPNSWGSGPQSTPKTFEFHQPTKVDSRSELLQPIRMFYKEMLTLFSVLSSLQQVRGVPPVKVIE